VATAHTRLRYATAPCDCRAVQGLKLKREVRKVVVSARGLEMLRQRREVAHHGLLATLVGEHPSAGHACRLAKRWVASQMLSYHLCDEAVELMVAAAYSRCGSHSRGAGGRRALQQCMPLMRVLLCSAARAGRPASPLQGFLRFLHLMAHHQWRAYPLLCDPAAALGSDALRAALRRHRQLPADGAPACALLCPYDTDCTAWTKDRPTLAAMSRACTLARSALATLSFALLAPAEPSEYAPRPPCMGCMHVRAGP
jgi:U3 small nucleolar RNA-associated protein 22